ncbi:cysteine hydrolase family protein [Nocardioides sp. SYSU D00038]|uniref:cysteine hydrolase family protein n=1 Tax=Nocardioides sp. SYSU D00038 TaxID=2812554 RepID=UPI001967848C|nr:isochorismatase family cysteine hydrolase [Nocardioides sp. SYSU D00038]
MTDHDGSPDHPTDGRTALLVIDLQKDYVQDPELRRCSDDVVKHTNELIEKAEAAGCPVVEVSTEHDPDGSTWALNMRQDDQGLVLAGTEGVERLDGLRPIERRVTKTRDSAFFETDLVALLQELGVDRLVLAGISTESCIRATAIDAYAHDFRVVLPRDATASVDEQMHDETLSALSELYRQPVEWAADITFD